jgi:membrane protein DedA with SNARE-associated domain
MFSFRQDKTGFFVTIILLTIVTGTLISTLVLLIVGMAQGSWKEHLLSMKWVLGSAWVACIITVLIRLRIYKWQYDRARERRATEDDKKSSEGTTDASGPAE